MQRKYFRAWTLALLQVAIVGNLQILPANAVYGFSLPFLYAIAVVCFYIPSLVMTAKLATTYPLTGGAYIWCEKAFGTHLGFLAVTLLWISNLLWYPSLFALIAANLAYLFKPVLAQNKTFVIGFSVLLFWIITALNCAGIKFSSRVSVWCGVVGIVLPMIVISFCGLTWWLTGKPLAISLADSPLIPDVSNIRNLAFLIAIIISLFGIELTAVHAGDVDNPKRNYPLSLVISSVILLILLLSSEIAISIIVPPNTLNVVTGLLDALTLFFVQTNLMHLFLFILILVFIGNLGSAAAWMLGSTRGMYVACKHNHVFKFLQKVNRAESPVGILVFEAIIFTCAAGVFFLFPRITDSFWLLLDLASQITLIYYFILFMSAIRLNCSWIMMSIGAATTIFALLLGFIPPPDLDAQDIFKFHLTISVGLVISLMLPIFFLSFRK